MGNRADLWRQMGFFTPSKVEGKIHVVGVGATGSHIVNTLACMGVENIVVYDFDVVEPHNLPNQIYSLPDVGKPKVDALKQYVTNKMGFDIEAVNEKVESIEDLDGMLILCTDSMKSQKEIFESSAKFKPKARAVIETRMGIDHGRVYFLDPNNKIHLKKYAAEWYTDEEAAESPCNLRAISVTAQLIACLAASKVVLTTKEDDSDFIYKLPNKTMICMDGSVIDYSWT